MSSDYELLTYKELTDRLGIKMASARQTVSRKGWRRIKQNDGTVKVEVPKPYLQRETVVVDVKSDDKSDVNVDVDMRVEIATLRTENAYLLTRISELQQDRDRWHAMAVRPWWKRLAG